MVANHLFDPTPGVSEQISSKLLRILAPNPSPMTFRGTNTYLLGEKSLALIDPGPDSETHFNAIMGSIKRDQRISHIMVTHSHIDHSPLAKRVSEQTSAPILAFGSSLTGKSLIMSKLTDLGGGEGLDHNFIPDIVLKDGDITTGDGWTLEALHTPGHLGNHLCFCWKERNVLFSGDLVMGWATSMVSPPDGDLTDFMDSILRLMKRENDVLYYPGHGAPIKNPKKRLEDLFVHRKKRESEILSALQQGLNTVYQITKKVYADLDSKLISAAQRNVLAHLIDLTSRNLCSVRGPITPKAKFIFKELKDLL